MADFDAPAAVDLLIVSAKNSSYEYYIEPRIDRLAEQAVLIRPFSGDLVAALVDYRAQGRKVDLLISRYLDSNTIRAINQCASILNSVRYFIDDDLQAMVWDRSVPWLNKVRPAQTEYYMRRKPNLFDCVYTSTPILADVLSRRHPQVGYPVFWPPIGTIPDEPLPPINPNQLYYLAKMHGPEHAFLWPVITEVLQRNPKAQFDVTANGYWARRWREIDRVTVHPEMAPSVYKAFVRALPKAGLFLLPLTDSKLNQSRSDTKLFEVINTGSVAIASKHPVYSQAPVTHLDMRYDVWVEGILNKMKSSALEVERQNLRDYLRSRNLVAQEQ